jgi:hypothetical protein
MTMRTDEEKVLWAVVEKQGESLDQEYFVHAFRSFLGLNGIDCPDEMSQS